MGFVVWGRCVEMCFLCVFFHVFVWGGRGGCGQFQPKNEVEAILQQQVIVSCQFCLSQSVLAEHQFFVKCVFFNILEYCLSCVLNSSARKDVFTHKKMMCKIFDRKKLGHVAVSGAGVLGTDCKIIEFMHPDVLECFKFDQAQVVTHLISLLVPTLQCVSGRVLAWRPMHHLYSCGATSNCKSNPTAQDLFSLFLGLCWCNVQGTLRSHPPHPPPHHPVA